MFPLHRGKSAAFNTIRSGGGEVDSTTFSKVAKFCLILLNKRVQRLSDFWCMSIVHHVPFKTSSTKVGQYASTQWLSLTLQAFHTPLYPNMISVPLYCLCFPLYLEHIRCLIKYCNCRLCFCVFLAKCTQEI